MPPFQPLVPRNPNSEYTWMQERPRPPHRLFFRFRNALTKEDMGFILRLSGLPITQHIIALEVVDLTAEHVLKAPRYENPPNFTFRPERYVGTEVDSWEEVGEAIHIAFPSVDFNKCFRGEPSQKRISRAVCLYAYLRELYKENEHDREDNPDR